MRTNCWNHRIAIKPVLSQDINGVQRALPENGFPACSDGRGGFQQRMWHGFRREPPEVASANSNWESTMTGHFTEMIIVSLLASAVLFGVLELFWEIWEDW